MSKPQKNTSAENEEMLRSGGFAQLALKLCIPAIMIMLVTVLYHMADIFFVGQMGDANKVAAVTLASPLFTILSGLGVLLGNGGCTAMSLALGRKDYSKIKKISSFCLWAAILIGIVFAVIVLLFMKPVCGLLGANTDTQEFTADYLRIIAIGAPVVMITNVAPSLIRADGSTVNSMVGNLIGTVLNIVLDPLLILTFHMGVAGAALATVTANMAATVYYCWFITAKGKVYSLSPKDISLEKEIIVQIITLGLPLSCSTILMSVSSTIANNLMMGYGATAVAGQSVAARIGQLISMTVMGICMGMQPAISYNYSAGSKERLTEILTKTTAVAVIAGTALSLLCLLLRDPLLNAFLDDQSVLEIGRICLLASVVIGPLFGFYQICTTYLQATGKSVAAVTVSLLEKGLIYIPALFILKAFFGMYGIVFSGTVTTVLSAVAALAFCYRDFSTELRK